MIIEREQRQQIERKIEQERRREAYKQFFNEQVPKVKEEYPDFNNSQVMAVIVDRWRYLDY